jgi:hypothetical protein
VRRNVAACALVVLVCASACVYHEAPPASYPAYQGPSTFDRAWDAAVGAAYDEGVQVTVQDRTSGIIRGSSGKTNVEISVRTQADGRVRVAINTRGDTALADRINEAYDRRMGR